MLSSAARRRPVFRATRQNSISAKRRTTRRPGSRPPAPPATRPRRGPGRSSITARPRFRSPAATGRPPVSPVMPTASSRASRPPASPVTRATFDKAPPEPQRPGSRPTAPLPHHGDLGWARVRPQRRPSFPLTGAHTAGHLPGLPRRRRLQRQADDLRRLPPEHLRPDARTPPQDGGLPDHMRDLPHHHHVDGASFNHGATPFPLTGAHRAAPVSPVTPTASTRASRRPASRATRPTTPARPPNHAAASSRRPVRPAIPHDLGRRDVQSHRDPVPVDRGTPAATCKSCHADGVFEGKATTCVAATRPTTTPPPIRTTRRRASRPRARPANTTTGGPGRASITVRRRSR